MKKFVITFAFFLGMGAVKAQTLPASTEQAVRQAIDRNKLNERDIVRLRSVVKSAVNNEQAPEFAKVNPNTPASELPLWQAIVEVLQAEHDRLASK